MRYYCHMQATETKPAERSTVQTHAEAAEVLVAAVAQQRKASVRVQLAGGATQLVGRAWRPSGLRQPWTWTLLPPRDIITLFPAVIGDHHVDRVVRPAARVLPARDRRDGVPHRQAERAT